MGLIPLAQIAAMVALAADLGSGAPATAPPSPAPLATRQTYFSIPFRIDRVEPGTPAPAAVELYFSTDQGANWQRHSRVEPARGNFSFRAGGDGEYWFFIRTLDSAGQARPAGPPQPGLRVLVDTTAPRLQVDAERGDVGQVTARWRTSDTNLKVESLSIQYRSGDSGTWQSVAIDRRLPGPSGGVWAGDVTWWPQPASERLEVRAEVTDQAGNVAVSHAQAGNAGAAAVPPKPIPSEGPTLAPPQLSSQPNVPSPPLRPALEGPSVSIRSVTESGQPSSEPNRVVFESSEGSVAIQIHPHVANRFEPAPPSTPNPAGLPPGERIRVVGALRFELEYALESVGPSGVAKMELFGTRDGGRTWTSFGVDDDKQSPMVVSVKEEGVYGFRIAVRSGAGLGGDPPQSGTLPDLWIGVDLTKPQARIVATEQLPGDKTGQLRIRWEAQDWLLATRPVRLLYSQIRGGPWIPIANDLENTGEHIWSFDGTVSERVFLRLEVQDEAGNLAIFETPDAVVLDQRRPQVRVMDVRPLGG